jgi:FMN-dependent NADH-azoreductase
MNILHVTSSTRGSASYSNRVASEVIAELQTRNPGSSVVTRNVAADPLPHIDEEFVTATRGPQGPQNDHQRALLARSDALVDELFAADVIVIAAPMINFTIPTSLKAWIDYVARAGRTFRYSEKGPEGLVKGKQVIIVGARGGVYAEGNTMDFQIPYLKSVLGFLGMTDVVVLGVDGTAYGPDAAEKAVTAATAKLQTTCETRVVQAA